MLRDPAIPSLGFLKVAAAVDWSHFPALKER
jgi:hypothetical protein